MFLWSTVRPNLISTPQRQQSTAQQREQMQGTAQSFWRATLPGVNPLLPTTGHFLKRSWSRVAKLALGRRLESFPTNSQAKLKAPSLLRLRKRVHLVILQLKKKELTPKISRVPRLVSTTKLTKSRIKLSEIWIILTSYLLQKVTVNFLSASATGLVRFCTIVRDCHKTWKA